MSDPRQAAGTPRTAPFYPSTASRPTDPLRDRWTRQVPPRRRTRPPWRRASPTTTISGPYRVSYDALERDLRQACGEPHVDGADARARGHAMRIEQLENAGLTLGI